MPDESLPDGPDMPGAGPVARLWRLTVAGARETAAVRCARVLAHPDLAERLTAPPLGYARPNQWTGYVPPRTWGRHNQLNPSPQRRALVEIAAEALRRDASSKGAVGAVADSS